MELQIETRHKRNAQKPEREIKGVGKKNGNGVKSIRHRYGGDILHIRGVFKPGPESFVAVRASVLSFDPLAQDGNSKHG